MGYPEVQNFQILILKILEKNLKFLKRNKELLNIQCQESVDKNKLPVSNTLRNLFLKLNFLLNSKISQVVVLFFSFCCELVPVIKDLPMMPERGREEFSMNDPQNVQIPESLGPLMYEIWPRLVKFFTELILGEIGSDELGSRLLEYPKAFSKTTTIVVNRVKPRKRWKPTFQSLKDSFTFLPKR